ncbi:hypothetical protein BH11PLA2_BH11PLA2_15650 [soil metagenome]
MTVFEQFLSKVRRFIFGGVTLHALQIDAELIDEMLAQLPEPFDRNMFRMTLSEICAELTATQGLSPRAILRAQPSTARFMDL